MISSRFSRPRETLEYELSSSNEENFIDGLRTAFFITEEHDVAIPPRHD
jgi:hypothetical protein